MADEQAPSESTTSESVAATTVAAKPGSPPVEQASDRVFTQADVDRIVKKRLGEGRVEPKVETKAAEIDPDKLSKKDLKNELDSMRAELARDRARLSFEKSAQKLGVPDDALDDLFDLHDRQKPEDTKTWLESKQGKLWMKAQPAPETPTQTTQLAEAIKAPAAASAAVGGSGLPTSNGLTDIFNLHSDQLARMSPGDMRTEFEKILKVGNQFNGAPQQPRPPQR